MDDVKDLIIDHMPSGVLVFDQEVSLVFSNKQAELFSKRFTLPVEIRNICENIFDAMNRSKLEELFPGEVYLRKRLRNSPSNWIFRFHIFEKPGPFVAVFIIEDSLSNRINLNRIRIRHRLTRRETDVLRRVLRGLSNADIAAEMEIAEQTVKDHLSRVYLKLKVKNRFALIQFLSNLADSETQSLTG